MKFSFLLTLCLTFSFCSCDDDKKKSRQKPFGYGIGPAYIGGFDSDYNGEILVREIYKWYVNYRRLSYEVTTEEDNYYRTWFGQDQCIGACIGGSMCRGGICYCNPDEEMVQVYGQCVSNGTSAWSTQNSDNSKFRKPIPPPIPEWCYKKDKDGRKKIADQHLNNPKCEKITYPNNFDPNSQFCDTGSHQFCLTKDMNMYCSEKTITVPGEVAPKRICQCRQDMRFDERLMECRIFLDVDCTYVKRQGNTTDPEINKILRGEKPVPPKSNIGETASVPFPKEAVQREFCRMIDEKADEYNEHIIEGYEFSFLGLGFGALFAVCCGSICAACCCCKCCNSVREKIRRLDPRNATRGMGTGTQMAALGAVAANEYMENKNDRNDEQRIAAMQGGVPGGAPPGYAPVPTSYPQGQYLPQQPGYAPVPTGYPAGEPVYPPVGGQPVYPPAPGPGYPPQQPGYPPAGQPGYIPPADQGILGTVAGYAPELALAGGGLATGNMTMAGMGAISAYEKMEGEEEKEDRLRAAAIKGVPPPPMGYAGGPTGGAVPPVSTLPPSTANYPRQQMS